MAMLSAATLTAGSAGSWSQQLTFLPMTGAGKKEMLVPARGSGPSEQQPDNIDCQLNLRHG